MTFAICLLYQIKKKQYGILTVRHVGKENDKAKFPSYLHLPGEQYASLLAAIEAIPTMLEHAGGVISEETYEATRELPGDELAEAVGVKTLTDLHRVAKILTLIEENGIITVIPTKRVNRGHILYEDYTSKRVSLNEKEELKRAIEEAFEKAENLKDWRNESKDAQ